MECAKGCKTVIDADCPRCDNYGELEKEHKRLKECLEIIQEDALTYNDISISPFDINIELGDSWDDFNPGHGNLQDFIGHVLDKTKH